MNLLRTTNALNLQDFLEHFELTLLSILHPRYNSIPAENRMGDTLSLKITNKVLNIQHPDRSRDNSTDLFRLNKSMQQSLPLLQLNLFEKRDMMVLLRGDPVPDRLPNINQMALL